MARNTVAAWDGPVRQLRIPQSRDPFINVTLLSLGPGETGRERFWATTWNARDPGCRGVVVDEGGAHRLYRFRGHDSFYGAVQEDADTLWLWGDLSQVVRLSLASGRHEVFPTGAPAGLVFQGTVFDRATGKLFMAQFIPQTGQTLAVSFDTRRRQTVAIHRDVCADHYMRFSFANSDGTHCCVLQCPGETLLQWDPLTETVQAVAIKRELDSEDMSGGTTYALIGDGRGHWYLPERGWYNPARRSIDETGPSPRREMTWFARRGDRAWGVVGHGGDSVIGIWDLATGEVRDICAIPDSTLMNMALSASGKIVAVNVYGVFYRFDGESGALEMSRVLPVESPGRVDCLCRLDERRLLGTPFITQRFWIADLETGEGSDVGRVAPGFGEITRLRRLGGKVYLGAYCGGELLEFDPARPPRFPENPRVVADPLNALRPMAMTDDGRRLYYACSRKYGTLGTALAWYDTKTGETRYADDPIQGQQVLCLYYDKTLNCLVASTTFHADCRSCPPSSDRCFFALLSAEDFSLIEWTAAPAGVESAWLGPLGRGTYLATCVFRDEEGVARARCFDLDAASLDVPELEDMPPPPAAAGQILLCLKPGFFLCRDRDRFTVWNLRKPRCVRVLWEGKGVYLADAQDDTVYLVRPREILVLDGCLKGVA